MTESYQGTKCTEIDPVGGKVISKLTKIISLLGSKEMRSEG